MSAALLAYLALAGQASAEEIGAGFVGDDVAWMMVDLAAIAVAAGLR